jgi:filamentous hemagglutinin family protein
MLKYAAVLIQLSLITTIGVVVVGSEVAIAEVTVLGGNPTSTTVNRSGSTWTISGGEQHKSSLFHSFEYFNITPGTTAEFKVTSAMDRIVAYVQNKATIECIINIVNHFSGSKSVDLFLLSPNGIIFGNEARINIKGALIATTANQLDFSDSVVFLDGRTFVIEDNSTPHQPIRFNFGGAPNPININDRLKLGSGVTSVALFGGEIEINNNIDPIKDGLHIGAVALNQDIYISRVNNTLSFTYPTNVNGLGLVEINDSTLKVDSNGSINLVAKDIQILRSSINGDSAISLVAGNNISLDGETKLLTSGSGPITLIAPNSISLNNSSSLDAEGAGDILLRSNLISLNNSSYIQNGPGGISGNINLQGSALRTNAIVLDGKSGITSNGSGSLNLSGQTLTLRQNSTIQKTGPDSPSPPANFNLGEFGSISLLQDSTINSDNLVELVIKADQINFAGFPEKSYVSYKSPSVFLPVASSLPTDVDFSCEANGFCKTIRIATPQIEDPIDTGRNPNPPPTVTPPIRVTPLQDSLELGPTADPPPVPAPVGPESLVLTGIRPENLAESSIDDTTSNPKAVATAPRVGRDSSSSAQITVMNRRCQGPIARAVLLQRSGRGGLIATPGTTVASEVFQDWGGSQIRPQTRSITPEASPVMEAHDWQVDDRGRVLLLAGQAIEGDRDSRYCTSETGS